MDNVGESIIIVDDVKNPGFDKCLICNKELNLCSSIASPPTSKFIKFEENPNLIESIRTISDIKKRMTNNYSNINELDDKVLPVVRQKPAGGSKKRKNKTKRRKNKNTRRRRRTRH